MGLWAGFLDRLPAVAALGAVRDLEAAGIGTVWLQEYSGVDPFVRAALYLQATTNLTVALGVATIHGRDPEAMVAVASTLEEAFPGRFALGLGVSHRQLAEGRGATYERPLGAMRGYLAAMDAAIGRRSLPARFLGALGPRMVDLAGDATDGVHTYFCPVAHTAATRAAVGPRPWLAPTQLVVVGADGGLWREHVRPYLALCLGLPNYRRNLERFGCTSADLDAASDDVIDMLAVNDEPAMLAARLEEQRAAGADHVVVQLVPAPPASAVLERVVAGIGGLSTSTHEPRGLGRL
jgi:probable F420-dependent oxidoreductase